MRLDKQAFNGLLVEMEKDSDKQESDQVQPEDQEEICEKVDLPLDRERLPVSGHSSSLSE